MSEKFTPAPWRIEYRTPICIEAASTEVAQVTGIDERQNIINAALIAAAPDLYAALSAIVSNDPPFTSKPVGAPHSPARLEQEAKIARFEAARAALKKARGEE